MKVTKHYEQDHVMIYVEEGDLRTCITLDSDRQMRRLGECLIDLERTGSREVTIEPQKGKAMAKETMKEMFDRVMADPNITESEMFKESEKFVEAMDCLTADIVRPCLEYANEHGDEDEGWAYTILISMARATCKMIYAFQHTAAEDGKDIFQSYHEELLPLCKEIVYRESDEAVAAAERMAKEAEEEEKGGVSQKRKEEVILAIADPEMTVDAIIDKFFKKDMTAEQRKMVADYMEKVRREDADKLAKVREMKRKED